MIERSGCERDLAVQGTGVRGEDVTVDEDAAVIAAELMPVAVFLGWRWGEVRPDGEIRAVAA